MASFELATTGIEVGYSDGGFNAHGVSVVHQFENSDWQCSTPSIKGMPVEWVIRLEEKDPFEEYVAATYPKSDLSPRVPELRDFFAKHGKPCGQMRRWDNAEPILIKYYLPNDPSLAAFIMGAVAAGRELRIWGQGWDFMATDDRVLPIVTVKGFMERKEPAYTQDRPSLKLL